MLNLSLVGMRLNICGYSPPINGDVISHGGSRSSAPQPLLLISQAKADEPLRSFGKN